MVPDQADASLKSTRNRVTVRGEDVCEWGCQEEGCRKSKLEGFNRHEGCYDQWTRTKEDGLLNMPHVVRTLSLPNISAVFWSQHVRGEYDMHWKYIVDGWQPDGRNDLVVGSPIRSVWHSLRMPGYPCAIFHD